MHAAWVAFAAFAVVPFGTETTLFGLLDQAIPLEITDRNNGPAEVGAGQSYDLAIPVPCTSTVSTTVGSTCSVSTSVDAVYGGQAIREGRRCSAAVAYLKPALARSNLTVETGALVSRIVLDKNRAVGVEYRRGGTTYNVRAHREVLAVGPGEQVRLELLLRLLGRGDGRLGVEERAGVVEDARTGGSTCRRFVRCS